ncbi:MAG TPA: tRNA pseudouridine(55) synthase TruB [Paracoccaceae bacterium]|nr:tRNA pseudouridine(55) synthase TruB [Paracoccaceae bacterium]
MGRARKGRAVSGWLVVDKPAGIGSTDVVARVRRAFGAAKAGHAGTLDPDATGVLAVALGEATKTVPYIVDATKGYRFAVRWGSETATDDAAGTVTARGAGRPDRPAIEAALPAFRGDIVQVPPQVSAVKVDGARAYDLARDGVAMDLAARPLRVEQLELEAMPDADTALFLMVCGKGGYVRSIARDLGRALGCLGHVLWLRREWSGPFRAEAAIDLGTLDRLAGNPELDARLLPLQAALAGLPEVRATEAGAARPRPGNPGEGIGGRSWGAPARARRDGTALAVGEVRGGMLHPARVFQ